MKAKRLPRGLYKQCACVSVSVPPKTLAPEEVIALVAEALDEPLEDGPASLVKSDEQRRPTLLILDEAQNFFLARIGGLEGWRPAEMKKLQPPLLVLLADLFNAIEATGEWPHALTRATVTLIPKGAGGAPTNQRPISCTSAVYRLWAGTRIRTIMEWQEKWLASGQM